MSKQCTMCGKTKEIGCFHRGSIYNDGYRPSCKDCRKTLKRQGGTYE